MDLTWQFVVLPRELGGARMNAAQITNRVTDLVPRPGKHILEIDFGPDTDLAALHTLCCTVRRCPAIPWPPLGSLEEPESHDSRVVDHL
ncbi:hypothetical protein [Streptomyces sp. st115]|uniref:hypothetical protein n=1 Tax=Streptomyces sp. st115 TaxID=1828047 RepID=UPI000BF1D1A8|nr:hypothetical protein [Streptomyces sp. st115]